MYVKCVWPYEESTETVIFVSLYDYLITRPVLLYLYHLLCMRFNKFFYIISPLTIELSTQEETCYHNSQIVVYILCKYVDVSHSGIARENRLYRF